MLLPNALALRATFIRFDRCLVPRDGLPFPESGE
jgi:hypothetical protein